MRRVRSGIGILPVIRARVRSGIGILPVIRVQIAQIVHGDSACPQACQRMRVAAKFVVGLRDIVGQAIRWGEHGLQVHVAGRVRIRRVAFAQHADLFPTAVDLAVVRCHAQTQLSRNGLDLLDQSIRFVERQQGLMIVQLALTLMVSHDVAQQRDSAKATGPVSPMIEMSMA